MADVKIIGRKPFKVISNRIITVIMIVRLIVCLCLFVCGEFVVRVILVREIVSREILVREIVRLRDRE